jgi:hypothetical protein
MTDRAIGIQALDMVTKLVGTVKRHADAVLRLMKDYEDDKILIMQELPDLARRLAMLEAAKLRAAGHNIPLQPGEMPPMRPEQGSSHEWDQILASASGELTRRVRNPNDRMTSDRAKALAKEVFQGVKLAEDAATFRAIKSKGWSTAFEILKWVALLAAGGLAARYGLPVPGGH